MTDATINPQLEQAVTITPRLEQAVRMLEVDRAGIATMVVEELQRNPLLEKIGVADPEDDSVVAVVDGSLEVCVVRDAALQVRTLAPPSIMDAEPLPATDQGDLNHEQLQREAAWFVRCLEQRAKTIQQLVEHLTAHNARYFRGEINEVDAIPVRAIAETLAIHESTVRRVASNKALRCTHGVVPIEQLVQ